MHVPSHSWEIVIFTKTVFDKIILQEDMKSKSQIKIKIKITIQENNFKSRFQIR